MKERVYSNKFLLWSEVTSYTWNEMNMGRNDWIPQTDLDIAKGKFNTYFLLKTRLQGICVPWA